MRKLFTVILILAITNTYARNYYFSNTGNDITGTGTIGNPYQTIDKLNTISNSLVGGDSVLFAGGNTFNGTIVVTKSGTAGAPIVYATYGAGQAIMSGLVTLTAWTQVGLNIWECSPAKHLKPLVNILTVNDVPVDLGRTPNADQPWLVYQTAGTNNITSTTMPTTEIGSEIVIKKNSFTMTRATITSQIGNTLVYATGQGIDNNNPVSPVIGKLGFGYFIQRYAGSLDRQNEWYYNPNTSLLRIYSTTNPAGASIKASYIDTLIIIGNKQNITVYNLSFEGAGMYCYEAYQSANNVVKNCTFKNSTRGTYLWNALNGLIEGNTYSNCINNAILYENRQSSKITVKGNITLNTGKLVGAGCFPSNYNFKAIVAETDTTQANNFVLVKGNTVLYTGYMGIEFKGANATITENYVSRFDSTLDDGGGIYTFNSIPATNSHWLNRRVTKNTVGNAIGSWMGTNRATSQDPDVAGIYYDEQVENIITDSNTVYNIPGNGIQMNAPLNISILHNTFYNCTWAILLAKKKVRAVSGVDILYNVSYQKIPTQLNFFHINEDITKATPMTIEQSLTNQWRMDSNYITNLKTASYHYYYNTGAKDTFPPDFTLAVWRGSYGHDVHSTLPPVAVTSTNTNLYTNPTDTVLFVKFPAGALYKDPQGNTISNSMTVERRMSRITIDNGFAANQPPIANAGSDITITAPANTTNLTGAGSSDPDGTIATYAWSKISGPAGGTFSPSSSVVAPSVNALQPGKYTFQLTVTDNGGLSNSDAVNVTVNAANIPPVVDAGKDTTIILPRDTVTINGKATDADGTIASYLWTKVSGPAGGTIASPTFASTLISGLVAGTYGYQLQATDNSGATSSDFMQIIVNAAPLPPTANAGADSTVTLPKDSVRLIGTATDPDGTITIYSWTKVSGPAGGNITSPSASTTMLTGLQAGTYNYKFTATDNSGLSSSDFVQVIVNPAIPPPNTPPTAIVPKDTVITLPVSSILLVGSGTDADGTVVAYQWTLISGTGVTINSPSSASTTISGLTAGIKLLKLRVTDNSGDTGTATIKVTVNAANIPPKVDAGNDITIIAPASSVSLIATATDQDGTVVSYLWTLISGTGGTIATPNSATTNITGLTVGTRLYKVKATDNAGDTATDIVQVTVNAANIPPVMNAGKDQIFDLPQNSTTLVGSGTDQDGTITAYLWTKIGGPTGGAITSSTTATTGITGLVAGDYFYQLRGTDNSGDTATATVKITVNAAIPNTPPIPNAGKDQTIQLPLFVTTITGSGTPTTAGATIAAYLWEEVGGNPSTGTIITPNAATTQVSPLIQGLYRYKLTVTDSNGLSASDEVRIVVTVAPQNFPALLRWH